MSNAAETFADGAARVTSVAARPAGVSDGCGLESLVERVDRRISTCRARPAKDTNAAGSISLDTPARRARIPPPAAANPARKW
jgi:hypothetical protein